MSLTLDLPRQLSHELSMAKSGFEEVIWKIHSRHPYDTLQRHPACVSIMENIETRGIYTSFGSNSTLALRFPAPDEELFVLYGTRPLGIMQLDTGRVQPLEVQQFVMRLQLESLDDAAALSRLVQLKEQARRLT